MFKAKTSASAPEPVISAQEAAAPLAAKAKIPGAHPDSCHTQNRSNPSSHSCQRLPSNSFSISVPLTTQPKTPHPLQAPLPPPPSWFPSCPHLPEPTAPSPRSSEWPREVNSLWLSYGSSCSGLKSLWPTSFLRRPPRASAEATTLSQVTWARVYLSAILQLRAVCLGMTGFVLGMARQKGERRRRGRCPRADWNLHRSALSTGRLGRKGQRESEVPPGGH